MFEKLIISIAKIFNENDIPYIILGGQAVLIYGEPRLTKDIDITVGLNIDALDEIVNILENTALRPIPDDYVSFVRKTMVLPLINDDSGIRVDIIFSFSEFERLAIKRANAVKLQGTGVNYVSLEDLIIFKVFAGRPRDLEDVRVMLIKNEDADVKYIREKLAELSFEENDFSKIFDDILESL